VADGPGDYVPVAVQDTLHLPGGAEKRAAISRATEGFSPSPQCFGIPPSPGEANFQCSGAAGFAASQAAGFVSDERLQREAGEKESTPQAGSAIERERPTGPARRTRSCAEKRLCMNPILARVAGPGTHRRHIPATRWRSGAGRLDSSRPAALRNGRPARLRRPSQRPKATPGVLLQPKNHHAVPTKMYEAGISGKAKSTARSFCQPGRVRRNTKSGPPRAR